MRGLACLLLLVPLLAGCAGERDDPEPVPTPATPSVAEQGPPRLVEVASGFGQPLWMVEHPARAGVLLVAEQQGRIVAVEPGAKEGSMWLDLGGRVGAQGSEQGLLGFAFHPAFMENGVLVLSYTREDGDSVLSRLVLANRTSPPDAAKEEVLLVVDQPFSNHNGGHVVWGPDGHLYFGLGDGGLAGDPQLNGQRPETLLGSLLRIDVGPTGPYTVPQDNPFIGDARARPEVWAYGLRNPWRFHFDRQGGDLWIGDVGQNAWEEVNRQPAESGGGENYGWNLFEGRHQFPSGAATPQVPGYVFPVHEYNHEGGHCSVTMGPVYRGAAVPALQGVALFADYCSGVLWGLRDGKAQELMQTRLMVSSFAEDAAGEVYILDHQGGRLLKLG